MKDNKRLAATAHLTNDSRGLISLVFDDWDGGDFDLHAKQDDTTIYLTDPQGTKYALAISGNNPEVLKRVGNALLALSRKQTGDDAEPNTE